MATSGIFYVYEHWRLDRDECFYVGKGKGNRAYLTKNRNRHHKAICAKLKRIGSAFEIRIVASGLSEEEAFRLERERIAFWRGMGCDLTNMTDGGEGVSGLRHSQKTKELWSKQRKGRVVPEEERQKRSATMTGRPKTKEHAANAGRAGGLARKGMKWSEESINARRIALINSEKFKLANSARRVPIFCLETNESFLCAKDAAVSTGVCKSSIHRSCKKNKKTKKGLTFNYKVFS